MVVDSGAFVFATTERNRAARALLHRIGRSTCHAPHLFDADVGNVLRRKVLAKELVDVHAEQILALAPSVVRYRYQHAGPLSAIAWQLRNTVTFYDALYVALAATLAVPLLTLDGRLSRAPDLPCRVELVG